MHRICLTLALLIARPLAAEVILFDAKDSAQELVIYSTLDARLATPLIEGFQMLNPGIAVRYEDLLAGEIADRVRNETDAGQPTADFLFSSAMDVQVKLANDGYAQTATVKASARWPRWANWRDTAYAVTFEPAVLVYHKPSFPNGPPDTRLDLIGWLKSAPKGAGNIGTYDIERSAVGYLFLARDREYFADIWSLVRAMAAAGVQTFPTSQDIIDRVADGRLRLGYNILGSYAAEQVQRHPDLGLVLLHDYTVVVSRVALVPKAAAHPDLGTRFLDYMLGREGQEILANRMGLPAISVEVADTSSARAMQARLGDQLRPVAVSPGLLVYLDQAKRRLFLQNWAKAISIDK